MLFLNAQFFILLHFLNGAKKEMNAYWTEELEEVQAGLGGGGE